MNDLKGGNIVEFRWDGPSEGIGKEIYSFEPRAASDAFRNRALKSVSIKLNIVL